MSELVAYKPLELYEFIATFHTRSSFWVQLFFVPRAPIGLGENNR